MAGSKLKRSQIGDLGITNADIASAANIALSKIAAAGDKSWDGKHTFKDVLTISGGPSNYLSFQFGNTIRSASAGYFDYESAQMHRLIVDSVARLTANDQGIIVNGTVQANGGSLVAGDNVALSGTLTNRLMGSGDITINVDGIAGTNLGITGSTGARTITSSTGTTTASIPLATTSYSGLMSPSDKASLDSLAGWNRHVDWGDVDNKPTTFAPSAHTHPISQVTGLQTALNGKEPSFSKNTAFNKDFGSSAGTVAEGDHAHDFMLAQNKVSANSIGSVSASTIYGFTNAAGSSNFPSSTGSGLALERRSSDTNFSGLYLWTGHDGQDSIYFKKKYAGDLTSFSNWLSMWHEGNFNPSSKANISGDTFTGNVIAPEFFRTSTRKVKKDISSFDGDAIEILNSVGIVSYKLKKGPGHTKIGFIAEDTHEYLSTPDHNVMDTGSTVGLLIKAVQELSAKVEYLERRLSCQK